jgi:hypothetical protein
MERYETEWRLLDHRRTAGKMKANRVPLDHGKATIVSRVTKKQNWLGTASYATIWLVLFTGVAQSVAADDAHALHTRFVDVSKTAGIDFVHTIGDDRMTNIVESTGVGCALLDYDGDGWLDIYFVNGMYREDLSDPQTAQQEQLKNATDRLYRNRGDWTFEDVTDRVGILSGGYGMAVVVGDYDNDGRRDIYVTNYGPNRLYRNLENGTFEEVARSSGVVCEQFSVGATMLDYDRDSLLDLYVGNYLDYVPDFDTAEGFPGPLAYTEQLNRMYRNQGAGKFEDVTKKLGLDSDLGRTMGVGAFDYNNDGFLDLFVANDAMENYFFENSQGTRFENMALMTNIAFGANGEATGAMGAEVGDVDGDGHFDLFVPDFTHTCLYANQSEGFFEDRARLAGIAAICGHYISWGAVLADFDLDCDLDLYIANGDANELIGHPDLVFANNGKGAFREVSSDVGLEQLEKRVSRGVAAGDLDNDGDLDLVVVHLNQAPVLLRNDAAGQGRHWLMVDLVGRAGKSNRDAVGAQVRCKLSLPDGSKRELVRLRSSNGSYNSVHDQRLHFGLGTATSVPEMEIRWPDGTLQKLNDVKADQLLSVEQPE